MKKRDVFVLIRTFIENEKAFQTFESCLKSVNSQVPEFAFIDNPLYNLHVVISDDQSPYHDFQGNDLKTLIYKMAEKAPWVSFTWLSSSVHRYSAANAYALKKFVTQGLPADAIVILLDQDDQLLPHAIRNIVWRMRHADICLTNYQVQGGESDISLPKRHAEVLEELKKGDLTHLPEAETLGWTKVWTGKTMRLFVEAADKALGEEPKHDAMSFFMDEKHRAYEDFLDFYILLRNDVRLAVNCTPTHLYNKTSDSITNTQPKLTDFDETRLDMLDAVFRMYFTMQQSDRTVFRHNADELMLYYLSYKLYRIEDILKSYVRQSVLFKDKRYKEFAENIKIGHIAILLANRYKTNESYCQWLNRVSLVNLVPSAQYKELNNKPNDFHNTLHELIEYHQGKQPKKKEESKLVVDQRWWRKIILIVFIIAILGVSIWYAITHYKTDEIGFLGLFAPGILALLSYLGTRFMKHWTEVNEEERELKIFQKEQIDVLRHLEANCKVLLEIRKQLQVNCGITPKDTEKSLGEREYIVLHPEFLDTKPAMVHFQNLIVPTNSLLFSDRPVRYIKSNDQIEHFARIRINLRNVNNSALQMMRYVQSKDYDALTMMRLIDWEITRYFGYITTFAYYKQENIFPKSTLIQDDYTYDKLDQLCNLFVSERLIAKRIEMAQEYLESHQTDRRRRRNIVLDVV